jgi:integral membrane protein (TIGR01906 family)
MEKIHKSGITHNIAAFICGLCLLLILLITATQTVCYWIPDWWRNEYAKYDTPSNVRGEMSLDDAVHVTEDMLEYCIGRLDTLDDSMATIDGVEKPFFTEREKSHLADCRGLFLGAIRVRVIACLLLIAFAIYIYIHNGKEKTSVLLARGWLRSLGLTAVLAAVVAVLCVIDFTQVFTVFHHIFFDNDLWILYPDKDNLINIMQEDVFSDAAMWIAGIWLAACAVLAVAAVMVLRRQKKTDVLLSE